MAMTHAAGAPCWFELSTTDQAGAERFYTGLFGWTAHRIQMGERGEYTMFQQEGRDVAAAYSLLPEQRARHAPSQWGFYFKVDDLDASVASVRGGHGHVVVPPHDVMDHLRMAMCADPERAVFSLSQLRTFSGAAALREPNTVCWVELATRDIAQAEAFYTGLFGWEMHDHAASGAVYRTFSNADGMLGGLMQMTAEWGEMPSHWSIYLQVLDVDIAVARALSLGGELCFPAFDAPGVGRIARVNDPTGAGFYLIAFPMGG